MADNSSNTESGVRIPAWVLKIFTMRKELKEVFDYLFASGTDKQQELEILMLRKLNIHSLAKILRYYNKNTIEQLDEVTSAYSLGLITQMERISETFTVTQSHLLKTHEIIDRYCTVWGDDRAIVEAQLSVLITK